MICEFSSIENEIKIQLVEGCLSSRVRRKAIQDDLSLANILAYARSLEITDKAVKTLEEDFTHLASTSGAVNSIYNPQGKHGNQYSRNSRNSYPPKNERQEKPWEQQHNDKKLCYNCGDKYQAGHLSERQILFCMWQTKSFRSYVS